MVRRWLALFSLVVAGAAKAQQTRPASGPAIDASTPVGALKSLAIAISDGNGPAIKDLFIATTPADVKMVAAVAEMSEAFAELRRSAVKEYGKEQSNKNKLGVDSEAAETEALANIDAAEIATMGDKATVRYKDDTGSPKVLRRLDGNWKVPISELGTPPDPESLDQRLVDLSAQARIVRQIAREIDDGKFPTADKAAEAWHSRMFQASATQPATLPSQAGAKQH